MVCSWRTGNPHLDAPDGIPQQYQWTPAPPSDDAAAGAYWVGINPDHPPGPSELQRKRLLPSVPVELADGRKWLIPIAKGIPHSIGVDYDTGKPDMKVDERFRKFSERAFRHASLLAEREEQLSDLQDVFFGVKLTTKQLEDLYVSNVSKWAGVNTLREMDQRLAISIIFDEALEHAIDALSINYRINEFLILHMQLFRISAESNHLRDICLAAIEAQMISESLKKNGNVRLISLLDG